MEPVSGAKLLSMGQVARLGIGFLFGFSKELVDCCSSGMGLLICNFSGELGY